MLRINKKDNELIIIITAIFLSLAMGELIIWLIKRFGNENSWGTPIAYLVIVAISTAIIAKYHYKKA